MGCDRPGDRVAVRRRGRRLRTLDEWTADRLGALERNILRLAIVELDEDAVPVEVGIDEAVTLAKRYSSEDAGRLVNGILGKIVQGTAA